MPGSKDYPDLITLRAKAESRGQLREIVQQLQERTPYAKVTMGDAMSFAIDRAREALVKRNPAAVAAAQRRDGRLA